MQPSHHTLKPKQSPRKPKQPKDGPRVNPADPVEEASYESFPASDSPAYGKPARQGETIPPGQPVPKSFTDSKKDAAARGRGENMDEASADEERRADDQASRDAVHERDRSGS